MIRKGIGKKLLMSYIVLIGIIFLITTILFSMISRVYVAAEVKKQLQEEALRIQELIEKTLKNNELDDLERKLALRRSLKVAGSLVDSHLIISNPLKNDKVLFTNVDASEKTTYVELFNNGLLTKDHIVYTETIQLNLQQTNQQSSTKNGQQNFQITLFTKMKDFKPLNQMMRRSLLISLVLAGAFSCVLAIIFEKKITRPIRYLEKAMKQYDPHQKSQVKLIESGDEIEVLSRNFISMVNKIEQYDIAQKNMLQNTSHELKTPIMSIQGYAEGIIEGVLSGEEATDALNIIVSESKRLKKTIDEVLYLSKLDNQQIVLKMSLVAIDDLVHSAVNAIKPMITEKKINLLIEFGDLHDETFLIDGEKILRALINLLGNSVRYAHHEIKLSVTQNQTLDFQVADDGDGFSEADLQHGVERFYKGSDGGTGLGLTITKAIAEAHGGTLTLKNQPKGGALVVMKLKI